MPQVGLHCIRGDIPHDECRRCALDPLHPCMFGPDTLEQMRDDPTRVRSGAFSPTGLLGCPREAVLRPHVPYYSDVEHTYPLVRGNMVHALMEAAKYPGVIGTVREKRFEAEIDTCFGPQRFAAKCDLIIIRQLQDDGALHCAIVDYKTTSKIGHDFLEAKPEHVWQLNMYAWVVTKKLAAYLGKPLPVVVDTIEVEYFAMEKPRRFTSAGPLVARGKRIPRTHPWEYEALDLEPVPLYPIEKTEAAIRRRIEQSLTYRDAETLPPLLPEDDRWRCMRCPVMETCYALDREGRTDVADVVHADNAPPRAA